MDGSSAKMAEASAGLASDQDLINYKCHKNQKVKTIVCLVCENVYHPVTLCDVKKLLE